MSELSYHGRLHLFACHALAGAFQYYWNYVDDTQIPHLHWTGTYEDVLGWIYEELPTPVRTEEIDNETAIRLLDSAEASMGSVYSYFEYGNYSRSLLSPHSIEIEYVEYCLWLLNILDTFEALMLADEMNNSQYQQDFIGGLGDADIFTRAGETVNASLEQARDGIGDDLYSKLVASAKRLARRWLDEILRVVNQPSRSLERNVGAFRLSKPRESHILIDHEGVARTVNKRIDVDQIGWLAFRYDVEVEKIVATCDISKADVYAALAYYSDNREAYEAARKRGLRALART